MSGWAVGLIGEASKEEASERASEGRLEIGFQGASQHFVRSFVHSFVRVASSSYAAGLLRSQPPTGLFDGSDAVVVVDRLSPSLRVSKMPKPSAPRGPAPSNVALKPR